MSWTVRDMRGDEVLARDGAIGTLDDVYFDDQSWSVRYLVVDTGRWVPGHRILVAPQAIEAGISDPGKLRVAATREELRAAPGAEQALPLRDQMRIAEATRLGPPYYWTSPLAWAAATVPPAGGGAAPLAPPPGELGGSARRILEGQNPHLRSSAEVIGYRVAANDGALGAVEDFVIDERTWTVSGMVFDTTQWLPGGPVRVPPEHVERIDWGERKVHILRSRAELKAAAAR